MASRVHILVVDDIPVMREILIRFLNKLAARQFKEEFGIHKVEISEAGNGAEALEQLQGREIHMIFLDLMLPEMDGLSFLSAKRDDPILAPIPVVAYSALNDTRTVERAYRLGVSGYMVKPINQKQVEENFRRALEEHPFSVLE